jgi:hypothetical protein
MKGVKSKTYPQNVSGLQPTFCGGKMGKSVDEVKYCSDKCRSNK